MSNTLRHVIGAVVGLLATPLLVIGVGWGGWRLYMVFVRLEYALSLIVPGLLVMIAMGVLLGVLTGSRISPLASLLPGVVLLVWGLLVFVPGMSTALVSLIPLDYSGSVIYYGLFGAMLVAASLWPSRWRAARAAAPGSGGPVPTTHAVQAPHGMPPHDAPPQPQQHWDPWQRAQPGGGAPPQTGDAVPHLYGTGTGPIPRVTDDPEPPRR